MSDVPPRPIPAALLRQLEFLLSNAVDLLTIAAHELEGPALADTRTMVGAVGGILSSLVPPLAHHRRLLELFPSGHPAHGVNHAMAAHLERFDASDYERPSRMYARTPASPCGRPAGCRCDACRRQDEAYASAMNGGGR